MRKSVKALLTGLIIGAMCWRLPAGEELPWGQDKPEKELPAIFKGQASERLKAEEVARMDAYRKLIERIYGFALSADTDIYDLVLRSHTLKVSLENKIRGMKEIATRYYEDGRVEVAVKITLREVVEIIERTYKRVEKGKKVVSDETLQTVRRENRDKEIIVVGRGALPQSPALQKIRAMRAAEIDCYNKIARKLLGLRITADTTVQDFALSSDRIRAKLCATLLYGVKFIKYEFLDDGSCEATGQITIRELIEVLTRTYKRYARGTKIKIEDIKNIERKQREHTIVEVGRAAPSGATTVEVRFEPFYEQKTVVERVIKREIVR